MVPPIFIEPCGWDSSLVRLRIQTDFIHWCYWFSCCTKFLKRASAFCKLGSNCANRASVIQPCRTRKDSASRLYRGANRAMPLAADFTDGTRLQRLIEHANG